MKLKRAVSEIASELGLGQVHGDAEISGVQLSSAVCEPGDLFIAIGGARHHGIDFLPQAVSLGAVAVLTDAEHLPPTDIPTLLHDNPKAIAGELADLVYGTSASAMHLLGVTGTNGKTSTVNYLQQLLAHMGISCGMSASTNRIVGTSLLASTLTTPEVTELHKLLWQMRANGQTHAAIEVSAQAMVRHRIDSVRFEVAGFSNLSRDHLDDFANMDEYLAAKQRLFTPEFAERGVVLVEDEFARKLYGAARIPIVAIGEGYEYQYQVLGDVIYLTGKHSGAFRFTAGSLMAKNFILALVMLLESGFTPEELESAALKAELHVPGRLELVSEALPHIYVDYAHTPAGVAAALAEIQGRYSKVTLVLGASGNRDQGKRAEMGVAASKADLVFITDQHPRDEDPALIRGALLAAARDLIPEDRIAEVPNPEQAIRQAIAATNKSSAILWCGPGHLQYREISGKKVPFDARAIARREVEK
ncbi:MAG: hypothetical protein RL068_800 [Actinomycetota bacterium]